jgi:hypothetical protein
MDGRADDDLATGANVQIAKNAFIDFPLETAFPGVFVGMILLLSGENRAISRHYVAGSIFPYCFPARLVVSSISDGRCRCN